MDNIVNKQAIIDEYLFGGISYRRLSKKYTIPRATLHEWVRDFTGIAIVKQGRENAVILSAMELKQSEELPKEIVALQKQLAQEKLHNKVLTAMIEIAETELKIPIRKKYGTRQSGK
ncbi:MAG TPA: hypothetical protein VK369_13505 [Segetibacter sp.]|jgi:transposase-like protein|nr:hypothetical protein [Segetibacter sp.]